jgi:hypothetical protein
MNNLNNDAELAKIDAKYPRAHADVPVSIGRQFSTYTWYPDGWILYNVECRKCKTRHLVTAYRGEEVACTSCGSPERDKATGKMLNPLVRGGLQPADLEREHKEQAKRMFEVRPDASKDLVAIVRYVRRHWMLDDRARVDISTKTQEKYPVEQFFKPHDKWAGGNYYHAGYHRLDSTFVATTAFVYDGAITQLDHGTVAKMLKGETPERRSWRLGSALALEEPVRPWNAPRTLDAPKMRSN